MIFSSSHINIKRLSEYSFIFFSGWMTTASTRPTSSRRSTATNSPTANISFFLPRADSSTLDVPWGTPLSSWAAPSQTRYPKISQIWDAHIPWQQNLAHISLRYLLPRRRSEAWQIEPVQNIKSFCIFGVFLVFLSLFEILEFFWNFIMAWWKDS